MLEKFFLKAISIEARFPPLFHNFGLCLAKAGRHQEAIEKFDAALKLFSNFVPVYCDRGASFFKLKEFELSLRDYNRALSLSPSLAEAWLGCGNVFTEIRRYDDAFAAYDRALSLKLNLAEAWLGRGNAFYRLKRFDEALAASDKALSIKPELESAWLGRGNALVELKRYDDALAAYDKTLSLNSNLESAWLGRGNVFTELKRFDEASAAFDKALSIKPEFENAWLGRGNVLTALQHFDEALDAYDKAISIRPGLESAWLGRGNAFAGLKRHDDALAAYDEALALRSDLAEVWLGRGNAFAGLKRYDDASAAYDKALALKADLEDAWLGCANLGNLFYQLKRYDEALAAYDKVLTIKPDLAEAWLGRGNLFYQMKSYDQALAAYDKALTLKPELAEAWLGRGNVLTCQNRYGDAVTAYDRALSLKPDLPGTEGQRLHSKMHLCDWSNFDAEVAHLSTSVNDKKTNTSPFSFLGIPSSAKEQLQCATAWVAAQFPLSKKPLWQGNIYGHERIRVAYLSADFHQHATSYLLAGIFECHDKSNFDITAISCGPDDGSQMRRRLTSSLEHFVDANLYSDDEIANLIRSLEIDLLVDLKGFTADSRTGVFSLRPAPVQLNYLGYPGTMGAPYIDYIIADRIVIPESHKPFYSEKVVYLPDSYQANDHKRTISDKAFTRTDVGLPPKGFVFCCFNNNYKITPCVFSCWMRILKQVDGSVLWLFQNDLSAVDNLRKQASIEGVNAERLIFAKHMTLPEHLARHRLADLFLDTLPINAHTTASDALWAGLPVMTCTGEAFAGRVAASLLQALHLSELITTTLEAYENMAIDLATHPEKLAGIKRALADNRLTASLFDSKRFTTHIEAAYTAMYERYQAGLAPADIIISD